MKYFPAKLHSTDRAAREYYNMNIWRQTLSLVFTGALSSGTFYHCMTRKGSQFSFNISKVFNVRPSLLELF